MKKVSVVLALISAFIVAGAMCYGASEIKLDPVIGYIGPAMINSQAGPSILVGTSTIGGNARNCLTDFSVTSSSQITISVLDSGTTVYAIDIGTSTIAAGGRSVPFAEDWYGSNALCGGYGSALFFTVVNSTGNGGAIYKLNYQGVIRGR